ncbi:hypothetical protein BVY03_03400 [bacterium K02(2017)]|nr:hypothetical protein BVY03_03400 [bacterium K02(2017)]
MIQEFYQDLLNNCSQSKNVFYTYYDQKHTYQDLYQGMCRINSYLTGLNQKKIVVIGEKSLGSYSAIYSILFTNNIWVPISSGLPDERVASILELLMPDVILYEDQLSKEVQSYADRNKIKTNKIDDILCQNEVKDFSLPTFSSDDWAYIMFTSGSTGVPKGVPMTHKNYINFIHNALEILPIEKGEVFSDYHDFGFDISIFYLFCAPLTESSIAPILKKAERMLPLNHMQKNNISIWSSVPSMVSSMQRYRPDEKQNNNLKVMFICGEPFSLDILKYCYDCLGVKHVYNFYGLTETGVENFYHPCTEGDVERFNKHGFVPIGKTLPGNEAKIASDKELLLSGCQITPGYLDGSGQERFEEYDGVRWYHTGDIVEIHDDYYFCKGRKDAQVKIGGYRVELMDIEVNVRQHEAVKEAICFLDEEGQNKKIICAVEFIKGVDSLNFKELKVLLKSKIPEYMVPKNFIVLDQFPVNNNGKIDRKAVKSNYQNKK